MQEKYHPLTFHFADEKTDQREGSICPESHSIPSYCFPTPNPGLGTDKYLSQFLPSSTMAGVGGRHTLLSPQLSSGLLNQAFIRGTRLHAGAPAGSDSSANSHCPFPKLRRYPPEDLGCEHGRQSQEAQPGPVLMIVSSSQGLSPSMALYEPAGCGVREGKGAAEDTCTETRPLPALPGDVLRLDLILELPLG